jgi:hypothetical protein
MHSLTRPKLAMLRQMALVSNTSTGKQTGSSLIYHLTMAGWIAWIKRWHKIVCKTVCGKSGRMENK